MATQSTVYARSGPAARPRTLPTAPFCSWMAPQRGEGRHNLDQGFELAVRADAGHHGPVAFSLLYLGLCRILVLAVSSRRSEADKDIELVVLRHQVSVL